MSKTMVRVNKPSDVPEAEHFAVLVYKTSSTYVPGDERSRTNPGHGYPAHTETNESFEHWIAMPGEEAILAAFLRTLEFPPQYTTKHPYVVLNVSSKCLVSTDVTVKVR